jgi:hypothetical protein
LLCEKHFGCKEESGVGVLRNPSLVVILTAQGVITICLCAQSVKLERSREDQLDVYFFLFLFSSVFFFFGFLELHHRAVNGSRWSKCSWFFGHGAWIS